MTKRLYAVHFMTYSLDQDQVEGMSKIPDNENSLCRSLIHYHTLLLPINDLKKRGACHFFVLQHDGFNLGLAF